MDGKVLRGLAIGLVTGALAFGGFAAAQAAVPATVGAACKAALDVKVRQGIISAQQEQQTLSIMRDRMKQRFESTALGRGRCLGGQPGAGGRRGPAGGLRFGSAVGLGRGFSGAMMGGAGVWARPGQAQGGTVAQ